MTLGYFHSNERNGFTLIELLVVISIISLLSSAVLSTLSGARESAKITRLASDLKQIEIGFTLWMDATNRVQYPEDDFTGSVNPSIKQLVNDPNLSLSDYLNSVPKPPFGNEYKYDNDGDEFLCGDGISDGVNIFVDEISDDNIRKEVNKIIEDDKNNSGDQDLECGRLRGPIGSQGDSLYYMLSDDGNL